MPLSAAPAAPWQLFPNLRHPRRTGPLLLRPVPVRAAVSESDFDFVGRPASSRGATVTVGGIMMRDSEADSERETVSRVIGWRAEK